MKAPTAIRFFLAAMFCGVIFYLGCKKPGVKGSTTTEPDMLFRAFAGPDKDVYLPAQSVILQVDLSTLPDPFARYRYRWNCVRVPAGASLPNILSPETDKTEVTNFVPGEYLITLELGFLNGSLLALDSMKMTVFEDTLKGTSVIAKAGPDQETILPKDFVYVDAGETYRYIPRGRDISFTWEIISKPPGSNSTTISNDRSMQAEVGNLEEGNYQLQLTVASENMISGRDTINIRVLPDSMKGRTIEYKDLQWERVGYDDGWGWVEEINDEICCHEYFRYRKENSIKVFVKTVPDNTQYLQLQAVHYAILGDKLLVKHPGNPLDTAAYFGNASKKFSAKVVFE